MLTLDLSVAGDSLVLTGSPLDRDIAGTINGITAHGAGRWVLPLGVSCFLEASMVVLADGGAVTPGAAQWRAKAQTAIDRTLALKDKEFPSAKLGGFNLFPAQESDARFLATIQSGMILSSMRTGKSATLFRTLDLLQAFPAYITTLPSITGEIERQARLAFPDKDIAVLSSGMTATQRKKALAAGAQIVIAGHNVTELHGRVLTYGGLSVEQRERERSKGKYEDKELNEYGFSAIVIDEGHAAQNPKAAFTRACWALGDKAEHRFLLTGTLAANDDSQMWAPLRFCYPKLFPARRKFLNRWINMVQNRWGTWECRSVDVVGNDGVKRDTGIQPDVRKEWQTIFDLMHVRRERTAGPEKEYRVVPIELPKAQLKAYRQMAEHSMAEFGDELLSATDSMSLRHRLNQLAGGTPVITNGEITGLTMPSAKVDALLDLLGESGDKAIVVCESRGLADLVRWQLAEQKIPAVAILGGMTQAEHAAAEAEFNTGSARVIVINKAGAFGKELPAARRTIFLERSFDYVFASQAEDRNVSAAQEAETVEVVDVFCRGTLDEAVREAFIRKDASLHERLSDKAWIKRSLYGDTNA